MKRVRRKVVALGAVMGMFLGLLVTPEKVIDENILTAVLIISITTAICTGAAVFLSRIASRKYRIRL